MYKYNLPISTNMQYNFIQQSTEKLLQCTKTHIDQSMIRYKNYQKQSKQHM